MWDFNDIRVPQFDYHIGLSIWGKNDNQHGCAGIWEFFAPIWKIRANHVLEIFAQFGT
jgi:hypothetical protein